MQRWPRLAIVWLLGITILGACGAPRPVPVTPTAAPPTPTAAPTAVPTFAPGSTIGGIAVGGLTSAAAADKVRTELTALTQPLAVRAGTARIKLSPADIDLALSLDVMLNEATRQARSGAVVQTPLDLTFNEQALREQIAGLAAQVAVSPTLSIITATETFSRSFAYTPGQLLDIDSAVAKVAARLRSPAAPRQVTLGLRPDPATPQADFAQIREQVELMAAQWDGVVGFYLYDLQSGATVTLNTDTVFSGASVMKAPIMLYAYTALEQFNADQEEWLRRMIVESDNLAANDLLAASVGGQGTDDALVGVRAMNVMLRALGLKHTYQNLPYEAYDYIVGLRRIQIESGPAREGNPPYTEADPLVRTTPTEISRIFLLIEQCSRGEGDLLEQFAETLSAARCGEMIAWLEQNGDDTRMVSGLPATARVAHKSGWVGDMQADVGIVRSPGGDFLLAVYLYQQTEWLRDPVAAPVIGAFARMVYTAYNPVRLDE